MGGNTRVEEKRLAEAIKKCYDANREKKGVRTGNVANREGSGDKTVQKAKVMLKMEKEIKLMMRADEEIEEEYA